VKFRLDIVENLGHDRNFPRTADGDVDLVVTQLFWNRREWDSLSHLKDNNPSLGRQLHGKGKPEEQASCTRRRYSGKLPTWNHGNQEIRELPSQSLGTFCAAGGAGEFAGAVPRLLDAAGD
jgi:hypothetical protein